MRDRFARYVAALRGLAEESGITDIPLVVNVHGTGGGRGLDYPIGISQLYEAYTQAPGYLAGSDLYLGDLSTTNAPDLYLANGFMAAVNRPEQPLACVEFECGDGNYDGSLAVRLDPSAADFKLRLSIAQGNRLVNHYLLAGGVNPRLDRAVGDGNDWISFTGERHGVAAPIGPEGQRNSTFPRLARAVGAVMALADTLAASREERDGGALGFVPDYYLTESVYPPSARMADFVANLSVNRGGGPGQHLARALLLGGFRFGCVDIQNRPLDPAATPVLALASARAMDAALQSRLADYLVGGGQLFLVGEVPSVDMEGEPCAVLANRLGLRHIGDRRASPNDHLSVTADGWAAPRPEVRASGAQLFDPAAGGVLLRAFGTDAACGFDRPVGTGRAVVVTADIPLDLEFVRDGFARLGAVPALAHGCPEGGIVLTSTVSPGNARLLHLLNLDGFAKTLHPTEHGRPLFGGRPLALRPKEAVMLPLGVRVGPVRIVYATAEVAAVAADAVTFRLTQPEDVIVLETDRPLAEDDDYALTRAGRRTTVTARRPARGWSDADDLLSLRFV